ncbi:MAG: hypothetical protein ABI083_04275 [Lapillicoccus sp.]
MTSPARGMLRLTRAGALALAILALSLAAHVLGGGVAPGPVGLALLTVPVLLLGVAVTGRRLRTPVVAAVFGAAQLGLHIALEALGAAAPMGARLGAVTGLTGGSPEGHLRMATHATSAPLPPAMGDLTSLAALPQLAGAPASPSMTGHAMPWWMTVTHVLAALACTLVLAQGEAALWRLWAWLTPTLPERVVLPWPLAARPSSPVSAPKARWANAVLRLRGPPAAPRPA